jgi:alpha/beta superfamily hydrolase
MPEVFFNGPAGRIEGRYTESQDKKAPIALILHPHPQYGGTMNNKVVYSLYSTLASIGFSVLRINFRGVGKSQGSFDNGVGEMMDAATALDWVQLHNPFASASLIAGFSFGSWIAMQLIMRRPEIGHFIAVSPPVNKFDFSFLSPCPIPGIIIQGDNDSIVNESEVSNLVDKLSQKRNSIQYKVIHKADHFFRDKLDELSLIMKDYVIANKLSNIQTHNSISEKVQGNNKLKNQKVFLD